MSNSKSVSFWKGKVWKVFSIFIRRSECDKKGYGRCVTCGTKYFWKKLQAGHFNPGRHNAILFDVRGVHIQCFRCNIWLSGNPREYEAYMKKRYGQKIIDELDQLSKTKREFTVSELQEKYEYYKNKIKKYE
jgi:hypothetical protein